MVESKTNSLFNKFSKLLFTHIGLLNITLLSITNTLLIFSNSFIYLKYLSLDSNDLPFLEFKNFIKSNVPPPFIYSEYKDLNNSILFLIVIKKIKLLCEQIAENT